MKKTEQKKKIKKAEKRSEGKRKQDQFVVVLEDLKSEFKLFGEALQMSREEIRDFKLEVAEQFEIAREGRQMLREDMTVLRTDVAEIKTDVAQLKLDVVEIKKDVAQLKSDVAKLKIDVEQLKSDIGVLKEAVEEISEKLDKKANIEDAEEIRKIGKEVEVLKKLVLAKAV